MAGVAGAHCMLENNKEGVRMYRRALATGQFEGENLDELYSNLGLAMLHVQEAQRRTIAWLV